MVVDTTFIYALTEPGTRIIRYFGKADDPKRRRVRHIRDASQKGKEWHVSRWIRKLLAAGQRPDVHILCKVPQNDFERFERAFIAVGRYHGFDLVNLTDGGDGMSNPPPEVRKKLSDSHSGEKGFWFGKKLPPEMRAKISEGNKGKTIPLEQRLQQSATMTGRKHSPEAVEKIRLARIGQKHSLESCRKMGRKRAGGSSHFRGLSWRADSKKWAATVCVSDTRIHLGLFVTEIEAAQAYDIAAKIHHGTFAKLNFPD